MTETAEAAFERAVREALEAGVSGSELEAILVSVLREKW